VRLDSGLAHHDGRLTSDHPHRTGVRERLVHDDHVAEAGAACREVERRARELVWRRIGPRDAGPHARDGHCDRGQQRLDTHGFLLSVCRSGRGWRFPRRFQCLAGAGCFHNGVKAPLRRLTIG
jgi:hypothetical protein